jgi:DHA3 family macrolide efflux protein-like MFS transporter
MEPSVKLFNKNFLLLWQGQLVSQLGNQAFLIGVMFWVKHVSGSASLVALMMITSTLPAVLLGPVAGAFADRYLRKNIIIVSDLLSGFFIIILALVIWIFPGQNRLIMILLLIVSTLISILATFFRPAMIAAIPDIVPTEKVTGANSLHQFSTQFATLIGQGIGGVLFRIIGAPMLFLVDGLSFIWAAFSETFIHIPQVVATSNPAQKLNQRWEVLKKDIIENFHYINQNEGLKIMYLVVMGLNFFFTPVYVLLPFFVEDVLKLTPDWYGYLMASFCSGAILGYILVGAIHLQPKFRMWLMFFCLFGSAGALISMGFIRSIVTMMAVTAIAGILNGIFNILWLCQFQLSTPSEMRGRVFGFISTLTSAITPVSMLLAGVATDISGKNVPLIIGSCGGMALLLSIYALFKKIFRAYLQYNPVELNKNNGAKVKVQ